MSADLNFNADGVTPSTGQPDPVPVGWYRMMIVASEVNPTKNNNGGKILKLEHVVLDDGPYKGRKAWAQLNIVNPSEQAQKIAQGELAAICHATRVMQVKNSSQLHNIPMMCKLSIEQDDTYGAKNKIRAWKAIDGAKPAAATATAATAPSTATAAAPAWAKKAS
jgi:hypothetical protein